MSKEIKIYALDKSNFKDLESEVLEVNMNSNLKTVNMGNTFFMKAYMSYKHVTDIDFTDSIIKVFIPVEQVSKLLSDGFMMNDQKYIAYTSTPSLQKKEDKSHKTEFIFIKKEDKKFINWFETAISLAKFKEKFVDNKEPIAINKKITSRTALAFSNVTKINCYEPRIIIVENHKYPHLAKVDIVATEGKGKDRKIILENNVPKLLLNQEKTIEHEANDGMGLMSPMMAQVIRDSMKLEYDVYFAVIRMFNGLAVKGMCMTFDMVAYMEEYNQNCTGAYGCYTVVDAYEQEQDIRQCDLLLTTSQAKWWENFKKKNDDEVYGIEEVNTRMNVIKRQSVKDMLSALYVTKVNKNPLELPTHTMSNYQLIGNLDLTLDQYKKLAQPTYNLYKGVRDGNMNAIKIFLKDFTEISTYIDKDGNQVIEEEATSTEENKEDKIQPSTTTEALLNIDSEFYKMRRIKQSLYTLVSQKVYNLMSGRVLIRGCYTYLAQDPIAMLNRMIGIKTDGELEENEFYCEGAEKDYVIQRNPCNCFNEIIKIHTTTNPTYEKWLNHIGREMVIFNAKDSTNTRLSGADFDGDAATLTDEEIILDTVIDSDTFFVNEDDGETEKMVYNRTNKMKALFNTGGNSIGTLANVGAKLSNDSYDDHLKHLPYLYTTLLMQQISIDSVKTMISVPKQMEDVLGADGIKKIKKPYFMKYRAYTKNQTIYDNDKYIEIKECKSVLDRYAKYCIEGLIKPYKGDQTSGDTSSRMLLNAMVVPNCALNDELVCKITDLYLEKVSRIAALKEQFESSEQIKKLLDKKKELEDEAKRLRKYISEREKRLDNENCIMDNGSIEQVLHEIYEAEKEKKSARIDIFKITKKIKPYREIKKAEEDAIKADIQLKCNGLVAEYGEDAVVRALQANRTDKSVKHTPAFLMDNFFDTMIKYMEVKNAYKLKKVSSDGDFRWLEQEYKKVQVGLEDSHIVAQKLIANMNKIQKIKGLGIKSDKVSMGLEDQTMRSIDDYNFLKNKTLKLKKGEKQPVDIFLDDVRVGWLFVPDIKGVNMNEVEEITIFDIGLPNKYTGKSIYIYFTM